MITQKYSVRIIILFIGILAVLNISCEKDLFGEELLCDEDLVKESDALRQTRELALDYVRNKKYEKAIEVYQKFINIYPGSYKAKEIIMEMASAYRYKGDFSRAIDTYRTIIEKFPGTPEAFSSLLWAGHIYQYRLKEYDKAIEAYNKVIESSTNDTAIQTAKSGITQCYRMLGKTDEAIKMAKDYLSKSLSQRKWAMGMMNLATLYVKKQNHAEAIKLLREIIRKYPKTEEASMAHSFLINIYSKNIENYQKALQECDNIINTYSKKEWIAHLSMAVKASIYIKLKDYNKAIKTYQTIIKIYPNSDDAKFAKASLKVISEYYKKGKIPSIEEKKKIFEEEGLKRGITSIPPPR